MVDTADGYDYVTGADVDAAHPHGDLDRIVVDGGVMPLRTGDTANADKDGNPIPRANILRGEDIAFLAEWANQRRFAVTAGKFIRNGVYEEYGGHPRDFATKGKTTLSRKLTAGWFDFPPYVTFNDLDDATLDGFAAWLFDDASAQFTVPFGTDFTTAVDLTVIARGRLGGSAFDASGLSYPAAGGALLKQTVMDYFDRAAEAANKGVGISYAPTVSFAAYGSSSGAAYQRAVETWTGTTSIDESEIPAWGVMEYDYDGSQTVFKDKISCHGHGYPPGGHALLSVDAPHADSVTALCAFDVISQGVGRSGCHDRSVLVKSYPMTKTGDETFALLSDGFASASAVDGIVAASGVAFPPDYAEGGIFAHERTAEIKCDVLPVVFFDDHTRWI